MSRVVKLFASLILLCCLRGLVLPQDDPSPKVIAKDKADALALAHLISGRLQRTQDIGPLINEYTVKEYLGDMLKVGVTSFFFAEDTVLQPKLSRNLQLRYLRATGNLIYLITLYRVVNKPPSAGDDWKLVLPNDVDRLMRKNKIFAYCYKQPDDNADKVDEVLLKNEDDVRQMIRNAEAINVLLRRYLKNIRMMPSRKYQAMMDKGENSYLTYFDSNTWICSAETVECRGRLPLKTPVIEMSIPGIPFIVFARVHGRMKVLSTMLIPTD